MLLAQLGIRWIAPAVGLVSVVGCVSVDPAPIEVAALTADLESRRLEDAAIAEALLAHSYPPLLEGTDGSRPSPPRKLHRAALAWNPRVRAARREVLIAVSEAGAAGLARNLGLAGEEVGSTNGDWSAELALDFDLLAWLGGGSPEAARALAAASVRRAIGSYEQTIFEVTEAVDQGTARLRELQRRLSELETLAQEMESQSQRRQAWFRRGWIAPLAESAPTVAESALRASVLAERASFVATQENLANTLGVPLAEVSSFTSDDLAPESNPTHSEPAIPSAAELLDRHPALRALELEYAVAEASLQYQAKATWPSLRIGPKLDFDSDHALLGSMVSLELPDLAAAPAAVRVGQVRLEGAREALADALLEYRNAAETVHARAQALAAGRPLDAALRQSSDGAWNAALVAARLDPSQSDRWAMDVERRRLTLLELSDRELERTEIEIRRRYAGGLPQGPASAAVGRLP